MDLKYIIIGQLTEQNVALQQQVLDLQKQLEEKGKQKKVSK